MRQPDDIPADLVLAKCAFVRYRRARHGVLQTLNGALMTLAGICPAGMLVALNQSVQLIATGIERTGKIQRNVR